MRLFLFLLFQYTVAAFAQQDSVFKDGKRVITLHPVVVSNKLNIPMFIQRVKDDTSFYKAFKNLHLVSFKSINDIRMLSRSGGLNASLNGRTQQTVSNGCRTMQVLEESSTGDIYTDDKEWNYYTAEMYASLFFTKGSVCGETNIVAGHELSTKGKSGMEKHKEQLKMLFFNPGRRISGLPFMSSKTEIYDDEIADSYNMDIDYEKKNNVDCIMFRQKVKEGKESDVVIDEMNTWFNDSTYEVVARTYSLSYDAGVYDFKVSMEVTMQRFGDLTVPVLIRYNGNWKAIFKKRERGVFTVTLYDFH